MFLDWRRSGSNRQPPPCKGGALPVELRPPFSICRPQCQPKWRRGKHSRHLQVSASWRLGVRGLEPRTSALSELRSNHLSYTPRTVPKSGADILPSAVVDVQCSVRRFGVFACSLNCATDGDASGARARLLSSMLFWSMKLFCVFCGVFNYGNCHRRACFTVRLQGNSRDGTLRDREGKSFLRITCNAISSVGPVLFVVLELVRR